MKVTSDDRKSMNVEFVPDLNECESNPISLHPASLDEAMRSLLAAPPESKEKHQNEHQ